MIKKIIGNKVFIPVSLICVFAIISAFSLFMNGDDYLWYYSGKDPQLDSWSKANGRSFSNQITIWLTRYIPFRIIFVTATIILFMILMSRLVDYKNVSKGIKYLLPLSLIIMIPCRNYKETFLWISGFTNYIFSMVIVFAYLLFVFKCVFDNYKPKAVSCILFFLLALIGGLCVEHITIYNTVLGVASFLAALKLKKKFRIHSFMFMCGSVLSCFFMFNNSIYSEIYTDADMVGNRIFKFEMSDVMHNAFSYVTIHFTKDFWIAPIIISVCFSVLWLKKKFLVKETFYLKASLTICWLYMGYSVFTSCFSNLRPLNAAMKIVAVETAFSFIYVVSVLYLIYLLVDKNYKTRLYVYIISAFIVTSPFVFISPVTPRCFFANYTFWILVCGELICYTFKNIDTERVRSMLEKAFRIITVSLVFMISFVSLSNRYFNDLRFRYIKEQIQSDSRSLKLMLLPYSEYTSDDLANGLFASTEHVGNFFYGKYRLMYYGIDYTTDKKYVEIQIMPYDYYMEKDD